LLAAQNSNVQMSKSKTFTTELPKGFVCPCTPEALTCEWLVPSTSESMEKMEKTLSHFLESDCLFVVCFYKARPDGEVSVHYHDFENFIAGVCDYQNNKFTDDVFTLELQFVGYGVRKEDDWQDFSKVGVPGSHARFVVAPGVEKTMVELIVDTHFPFAYEDETELLKRDVEIISEKLGSPMLGCTTSITAINGLVTELFGAPSNEIVAKNGKSTVEGLTELNPVKVSISDGGDKQKKSDSSSKVKSNSEVDDSTPSKDKSSSSTKVKVETTKAKMDMKITPNIPLGKVSMGSSTVNVAAAAARNLDEE